MGVEPTSRAAKERDNGFEDREDHRAPFASASSIAWISTLDRRVPRELDRVEACWLLVESSACDCGDHEP